MRNALVGECFDGEGAQIARGGWRGAGLRHIGISSREWNFAESFDAVLPIDLVSFLRVELFAHPRTSGVQKQWQCRLAIKFP